MSIRLTRGTSPGGVICIEVTSRETDTHSTGQLAYVVNFLRARPRTLPLGTSVGEIQL